MTQTPNPFGDNPFETPTPAGPPTYTAPPPTGGAQPANTLATLSVIFAFIFAPAGAILGHLGLNQIRRTGQPGRHRALIAVVVSYVIITLAVLAIVLSLLSKPDKTCCAPPPAAGPSTDLSALIPGIEELKTLTRDADLVPQRSTTSLAAPPGKIDPADCQASFSITNPNVVDLHAVRGVYRIDYHGNQVTSGSPLRYTLQLSVIAYPDSNAAAGAVRHTADLLQDCADHSASVLVRGLDDGSGTDHHFGVASVHPEVRDIASQISLTNDSSGEVIERVVAARSNIAIDLLCISQKLPRHTDLLAIANAIQAKISG